MEFVNSLNLYVHARIKSLSRSLIIDAYYLKGLQYTYATSYFIAITVKIMRHSIRK